MKLTVAAVDLFCGAGGLTAGLEAAGVDVRLGVDVDPACRYPYETNNKAEFLLCPVEELKSSKVRAALKGADYRLLAGCAPCQPFSTYRQGHTDTSDKRWNLLQRFGKLVEDTKPHFVTMENVPRLEHQDVFQKFLRRLVRLGYHVSYSVVNCADYGVPQYRERLVLLASRFGPIDMIEPTHPCHRTVKQAIGRLGKIEHGATHSRDRLHQACSLSPLNFKRIKASKPGGTWRDWESDLVAPCHAKETGKTYPGVYGRMGWHEPAPTMTTQFYAFGSGRFGHPEQNRALSLREGALLQSFPRTYKFVPPREPVIRKTIGRLIGNAVPVKLGEAIGKSILQHVNDLPQKPRRKIKLSRRK